MIKRLPDYLFGNKVKGVRRWKFLNACQWIVVAGANVNAASGKTSCRFPGSDKGDFKASPGKKRSRCQACYTRSDDYDIVFGNAHFGFSMARMPR